MPVADGGGARLVPCSGAGPMVMGAGHAHDRHDGQSRVDSQCPFAAAAVPLLDAPPPPLAPPAPRASYSEALPAPAAAVGRGLAAPPPPATGPPLSA